MLAAAIYWNVDPVMFNMGSFGLRYYSLGFLLAFTLGYYILWRMFNRERVKTDYLERLVVYVFLATLVGARLGHCLFYEPDRFLTSDHWTEIFWPFENGKFTGFQGLASHGAAIGILLTMWLYWRRYRLNVWWPFMKLDDYDENRCELQIVRVPEGEAFGPRLAYEVRNGLVYLRIILS